MAWACASASALLVGDHVRLAVLTRRVVSAAEASGVPGPLRYAALVDTAATIYAGDWDGATRLAERTSQLGRAAGDVPLVVVSTGAAAIANAYAGRPGPARRLGDATLEVARASGDAGLLAWGYYYAGEARLESAPAEALPMLDLAVAQARNAGHHFVLGVAGLSAVSLRARRGDAAATLGQYAELIEHWHRAGWWQQLWLTLRSLEETLARAGQHEPAAVLHGAMPARRHAPPLNGPDAIRLGAVLTRLREVRGDEELIRRQTEGAALGDAGAVAYAHAVLRGILGRP